MDHKLMNILSEYQIGNVIKIEPIGGGNTSETYKITTNLGYWVLRSLKDDIQGKLEYQISEHVNKENNNIVPKIMDTTAGNPFVIYDGDYYNVQPFIEGKKVNQDMNHHYLIGMSLGLVHKSLATLNKKQNQADRFDLYALWSKVKGRWDALHQSIPEIFPETVETEAFVENILLKTSENNSMIHGDLGIWNMLFKDGTIIIYDFGEARFGNVCFDVAAAITSSIKIENDIKMKANMYALLKGYEENRDAVDLNDLLSYIQLWYLRGVFALIGMSKKENDVNVKQSIKFMNALYRYNRVISEMS